MDKSVSEEMLMEQLMMLNCLCKSIVKGICCRFKMKGIHMHKYGTVTKGYLNTSNKPNQAVWTEIGPKINNPASIHSMKFNLKTMKNRST